MVRQLMVWLLALAPIAGATTLVAMNVPALTRSADVVVRGTVVRVESRWTSDHRKIVTDSEILIDEVLKGSVPGKTIVAMQPGGVVGDVGQLVHGAATFRQGEEVVVFLEKRGDRGFVVGLAQGRFVVDRSGPEPVVRGGEEHLYLVDDASHRKVDASVQVMSLEALVRLVRQAQTPSAPSPAVLPPGILKRNAP